MRLHSQRSGVCELLRFHIQGNAAKVEVTAATVILLKSRLEVFT